MSVSLFLNLIAICFPIASFVVSLRGKGSRDARENSLMLNWVALALLAISNLLR